MSIAQAVRAFSPGRPLLPRITLRTWRACAILVS